MKKFVAVIIIICVVFGAAISIPYITSAVDKNKNEVQNEVSEVLASTDESGIDYASIYALHDPAEIVAVINGNDIAWSEYFHWLHYNMVQAQNVFTSMKMYYNADISWTDDVGNGTSYADYVTILTEDNLRQIYALMALKDKLGVGLEKELDSFLKTTAEKDAVNYCGEGAGLEELNAFLNEQYSTLSVYNKINTASFYYNEIEKLLYGENYELVTDEQALSYLKDNGYIYRANHILLMSEEENADILAKAQAFTDELRAIENIDELVARFNELKTEFDEDTGKVSFPDGYVFGEGQMVAEFENAVNSIADYEVSDPVKSAYGYHVIMRLPLDADAAIDNSGNSARVLFADADYSNRISEVYNSVTINYAEGFVVPSVLDFIA